MLYRMRNKKQKQKQRNKIIKLIVAMELIATCNKLG